jgi:two-component system cell cycle response regulator
LSQDRKSNTSAPPGSAPQPVETVPPTDRNPARRDSGAFFDVEEEASTRQSAETVVLSVPSQQVHRTSAQLTVIAGPNAGRAYSLPEGETVLGRGREAQVFIDDAGASRMHARIVVTEDGRYVLEDLKSRNGTFLGSRRVDRAELTSGDRIAIGSSVTLSFAILDAQAERMAHQLYESSVRDALTRAHNRRYLVERLGSEIAYAKRHKAPLSLIMFDIDHFKLVNDGHGHLTGDEVLREVAALVARMIRTEDVFARYGGEEFVVLARGIEHDNAGLFAERLRAAIEALEVVTSGDAIIRVTISAGYAALDELGEGQRTAEGLIRLADARLYGAKAAGRNQTHGE